MGGKRCNDSETDVFLGSESLRRRFSRCTERLSTLFGDPGWVGAKSTSPMGNRRQDDLDRDEEDAVMYSHHTSDEDNSSDNGSDVDEYANYRTDLEKYEYDQLRWNGIGHSRKYTIDPRHKEERRKKANSLECERTSSSEHCRSFYAVCLFLLSHIPLQPRSQ